MLAGGFDKKPTLSRFGRRDTLRLVRDTDRLFPEDVLAVRSIIENLPLPVVVSLDPECRTVVGNRRTCESLPVPFRIMQNGVEVPRHSLPMEVAGATSRDVLNFSCQFVSDRGISRHMLCSAVPLLDSRRRARGSVATFADVTALNQFEGRIWDPQRLEGLRMLARHAAGEFLTALAMDISRALDDFFPPRSGPQAVPAHAPSSPSGTQGVVLIVDDESSIRGLVAAILKTQNIPCIEASGGAEAIEQVRMHGASIRMIILDITMPGTNGDHTLPAIRELLPGVPYIVTSGYSESDVSRHLNGPKFAAFLPKPYSVQQLLEKVLPAFKPETTV